MSDNMPKDPDKLEAYLDNLLTDQEADSFLTNPENREQLVGQKELQSRIDESIRRTFRFEPLNEDQFDQIAGKQKIGHSTRPRYLNRRQLTRLAIAASLFALAGFGIWQVTKPWRGKQPPLPFFEARSLPGIYDETIRQGFKPGFACHDRQLFAEVFRIRQGQPLALGKVPEGRRMLGISYLGGMSRNTTAMLCEVDGTNVIVFVDNVENDDPDLAMAGGDGNLHTFRVVKNGLVFYEVSTLDNSKMIEHLVITD